MQNSLGIITPDITRSLGETRLLNPGEVNVSPLALLGVPMPTLVAVVSMSMFGSSAAGYAATGSAKGGLFGAVGGLVGSIGGIAIAGFIQKRQFEKLAASFQVA